MKHLLKVTAASLSLLALPAMASMSHLTEPTVVPPGHEGVGYVHPQLNPSTPIRPGEIRGVWTSRHMGASCSNPRRDELGMPVYLVVTDHGFSYGALRCGFGSTMSEPARSIKGDMPCFGQQPQQFSGYYELEAAPAGDILTFQQGIGSARFVQTMEICQR